MQLILVAAAALASMVAAKPNDACTTANLDDLKSSACMGSVITGLTAANVDLAAKSKTSAEATKVVGLYNQTSNLTEAFNNIPSFKAAILAKWPNGINYDNLTRAEDAPLVNAYNNIYQTTVCPTVRAALDTITTCIPKSCNETTWAYCNNQTSSDQAGIGTLVATYAISIGAVMKTACLNWKDTDGDAKCRVLFPASLFGTYVPPVVTTKAPTASNGTSASSTVEIAVLAAASLVATTMLAF